jgi:hypothetical protein
MEKQLQAAPGCEPDCPLLSRLAASSTAILLVLGALFGWAPLSADAQSSMPPYLAMPFSATNITFGTTLTFTALATNRDGSTDPFTFSLDRNAVAAGATISPTTGVFSWTPTAQDASFVFDMAVIVTETKATTSLCATQAFSVVVLPPNWPPVFQNVTVTAGVLTLTWSAFPMQMYQVQYKTNWTQTNWDCLGDIVFATDFTLTASDSVAAGPSRKWYRVVLLP